MGKFSASRKLSKQEQQELFIDFARALASVRNSLEAANFVKDLLSEQESLMLSRRLQIARLLDKGFTYQEIHKVMKVSNTTITKVQTWLNLYGEGYRLVLKRTEAQPKQKDESPLSWGKLKKQYPMYYWPELVLKEIVSSANKREKGRLVKVIEGLKEKTHLSKDLMKILSNDKRNHTQ